jgi:hypothetical protein
MWLAEARKRKLQVGNSTGNCKGRRSGTAQAIAKG